MHYRDKFKVLLFIFEKQWLLADCDAIVITLSIDVIVYLCFRMRVEDVILNIEIEKMDSFNQYLKLLILERLNFEWERMEERIITPIDRDKHEDFPPLIFREIIAKIPVKFEILL